LLEAEGPWDEYSRGTISDDAFSQVIMNRLFGSSLVPVPVPVPSPQSLTSVYVYFILLSPAESSPPVVDIVPQNWRAVKVFAWNGTDDVFIGRRKISELRSAKTTIWRYQDRYGIVDGYGNIIEGSGVSSSSPVDGYTYIFDGAIMKWWQTPPSASRPPVAGMRLCRGGAGKLAYYPQLWSNSQRPVGLVPPPVTSPSLDQLNACVPVEMTLESAEGFSPLELQVAPQSPTHQVRGTGVAWVPLTGSTRAGSSRRPSASGSSGSPFPSRNEELHGSHGGEGDHLIPKLITDNKDFLSNFKPVARFTCIVKSLLFRYECKVPSDLNAQCGEWWRPPSTQSFILKTLESMETTRKISAIQEHLYDYDLRDSLIEFKLLSPPETSSKCARSQLPYLVMKTCEGDLSSLRNLTQVACIHAPNNVDCGIPIPRRLNFHDVLLTYRESMQSHKLFNFDVKPENVFYTSDTSDGTVNIVQGDVDGIDEVFELNISIQAAEDFIETNEGIVVGKPVIMRPQLPPYRFPLRLVDVGGTSTRQIRSTLIDNTRHYFLEERVETVIWRAPRKTFAWKIVKPPTSQETVIVFNPGHRAVSLCPPNLPPLVSTDYDCVALAPVYTKWSTALTAMLVGLPFPIQFMMSHWVLSNRRQHNDFSKYATVMVYLPPALKPTPALMTKRWGDLERPPMCFSKGILVTPLTLMKYFVPILKSLINYAFPLSPFDSHDVGKRGKAIVDARTHTWDLMLPALELAQRKKGGHINIDFVLDWEYRTGASVQWYQEITGPCMSADTPKQKRLFGAATVSGVEFQEFTVSGTPYYVSPIEYTGGLNGHDMHDSSKYKWRESGSPVLTVDDGNIVPPPWWPDDDLPVLPPMADLPPSPLPPSPSPPSPSPRSPSPGRGGRGAPSLPSPFDD
jgi:hypothetical protein